MVMHLICIETLTKQTTFYTINYKMCTLNYCQNILYHYFLLHYIITRFQCVVSCTQGVHWALL